MVDAYSPFFCLLIQQRKLFANLKRALWYNHSIYTGYISPLM